MMTGYHTTLKAEKINDQVLRKINSEAARLAVFIGKNNKALKSIKYNAFKKVFPLCLYIFSPFFIPTKLVLDLIGEWESIPFFSV